MIRYTILGWLCLSGVSLSAAEPSGRTYDLSYVEGGERFEGSPAARRLLERQGFVVTEKQFRQIFEAYLSLGPDLPIPNFITVDSSWHTYHLLLEEGVRQFEEAQAVTLAAFSRKLYRLARAKIAADGDVYADLALFAAVAWALQDDGALARLNAEDRPTIERVLGIFRDGGPPQRVLFFDLPVMPEQYRAAGFYIRSSDLKGYFAARKWYATNVFRVGSEAETERAVHLALLIGSDIDLQRRHRQLSAPYDILLAPAEDAGAEQYASLARRTIGKTPSSEQVRQRLGAFRQQAAKLPGPSINDQYLPLDDYARFSETTKGFRLLPPRRVPSAVLFQRTVDPKVKNRGFPSGLDFFATGAMASDAGRRALRQSVDDATADAILAAETVALPNSLHGQALSLLGRLQEPLPEQAPGPLRTAAWQDKQLVTQLGAWAQQRHTWALHTKLTVHFGGGTMEPPGYVSPYPEFFRGLGRLSRDTARVLREAMDQEAMGPVAGHALLDLIAAARRIDASRATNVSFSMVDSSKSEQLWQFGEACRLAGVRVAADDSEDSDDGPSNDYSLVERIARRWIESEKLSQLDRQLIASLSEREGRAGKYLVEFAELCDRLAAIAEKQLAGRPFAKEDVRLIKDYGKTLARFHFYGGNSYLVPRDDFPQVVPIFCSPLGHRNELLYAGLPRPEAVYVILRVGNRFVLHRGAVLSYREFRRPADKPLDDESWAREVYAGRVPPPPAFTASFRQTVTEEEVARMLRSGKRYVNAAYMVGDTITDAMLDALMNGAFEDTYWLREQVARRMTEAHIPRLLDYLQTRSPGREAGHDIGAIVLAMTNLDWRPHRQRVLELLHHEVIQVADAAAYILAQRPDELDAAVLAKHSEKGKLRTRRLIGYLLGQLERPDHRAFQLVLEMMDHEHPALRYQAMLAGSRWQANGVDADALPARFRQGLILGIEDRNDVVAATAAHAVVALGLEEAAPKMLKRLEDEGRYSIFEDDGPRQQDERKVGDVFEKTHYGGISASNVLGRPHFSESSLAAELLAGLKAFRYRPAKEHLHAMLGGTMGVVGGYPGNFGPEALDVLVCLEPEPKAKLLMAVVRNTELTAAARSRAVERLAETKDIAHVAPLLPLLKDGDALGSRTSYYPEFATSAEFVGGSVALAVAKLLLSADPEDPTLAELRKEAVKQMIPMLHTTSGPSALAALTRIEPEQSLARLMRVATDREFPVATRGRALDLLSFPPRDLAADWSDLHRDIRYLRRLLPLIEDDTGSEYYTMGDEVGTLIGCLSPALAQNPAHAQEVAEIGKHLASLLTTRHASAAFNALQQIDSKLATERLIAIAGDRECAAATRVRALKLLNSLAYQDDFLASVAPLLVDQTEVEKGERICDLMAQIIAKRLQKGLPFPASNELHERNAFIGRVRKAVEESGP